MICDDHKYFILDYLRPYTHTIDEKEKNVVTFIIEKKMLLKMVSIRKQVLGLYFRGFLFRSKSFAILIYIIEFIPIPYITL